MIVPPAAADTAGIPLFAGFLLGSMRGWSGLRMSILVAGSCLMGSTRLDTESPATGTRGLTRPAQLPSDGGGPAAPL
jgi:hypothetical protein